MSATGQPSLEGFINFIYSGMGVPVASLPTTSPLIEICFNLALELTPHAPRFSEIYTDAVYNAAAHILVDRAQDVTFSVTASFAAGFMIVTEANGIIAPKMQILGVTSDTPPPTVIAFQSGTGGLGSYSVSITGYISPCTFSLRDNFWSRLRGKDAYNVNAFKPGVVSSTHDESTGVSFEVANGLKNLTIGDLQFMTTPWGRRFLAYCQQFSEIWGLT